ncbi:DUF998 domain-containing protein [Micromonospora sp. LAH09]|uniref:DUF998 domain-containing protein n=1 Tax=Micromonospora cabrerizensis TaxID=2911213 RepID=UPI001EE9577C|nr:DUF998 domain-containing protein [Micromonospora cabrerizensis]MCG5472209.1 DUF998 domain-containing protein [Micromonospora cabrerizensis]
MSQAAPFPLVRPAAVGRDRVLLIGGVLAGPIFVGSAIVQASTREGFDFRRHPVSVLSTGELGWIQIVTFLVSGVLCALAADALRRRTGEGGGSVWLPRLLALYGLGLIGAAIFSADPADGFPVGTPRGAGQISWHGGLHFLVAAVAFVSLIAATVVASRRSARQGAGGRAAYSLGVGIFFAVAWVALIVRPAPAVMVAFGLAVTAGWLWVSVTFARAASGQTD